jgi:hypothetical protein
MTARPDSFYIYPINQYLYFNAVTTASCPAYTAGDFVEFVHPNHNTNVERIPAQTSPLIRVTTHCAGSEASGIKAEKVFSIEDRYYRITAGNEDVYFRITEISNDYNARIEFSHSPYSTGIAYKLGYDITSQRMDKSILETTKGIYLINGKYIQKTNEYKGRK